LPEKGGNAAYTVRHLYQKLLVPFDEHRGLNAGGGTDILGEPCRFSLAIEIFMHYK
jgi:hypothetical protein